MRCMTLAIIFSAFGWIALASNSNAFETLELPPLTAETSAVNLSSSSSSRPHYVVLTGNQTRSEISSSEISSATEMTVPQPQAMKANNSNPPPSFAGNDPGSYHGYRPPMPFGPSRIWTNSWRIPGSRSGNSSLPMYFNTCSTAV